MFVPFNVVKNKNRTIAGREIGDCFLQLQPVDGPGQRQIVCAEILFGRIVFARLRRFFQRNHWKTLSPQLHQYHIHRESMQPC